MIFKLLVVDDEVTMRKGISNYMNWASIDCQVVGSASDGMEAIDFLKNQIEKGHKRTALVLFCVWTNLPCPYPTGLPAPIHGQHSGQMMPGADLCRGLGQLMYQVFLDQLSHGHCRALFLVLCHRDFLAEPL